MNGVAHGPISLLETLNELGGRHGIGRVDLVENRLVGMKSHGVYETPGGTILMTAHKALETLTLERETAHYKQQVSLKYAEMVYYGQWFCQLRHALDAFVDVAVEADVLVHQSRPRLEFEYHTGSGGKCQGESGAQRFNRPLKN